MPENRCRCSATCPRSSCQEKAHWAWNPDLVTPRPSPWPWGLSTWDSDACPATTRTSFWYYTTDGTPDSMPWAAAAVGKGCRARITKPSWVQSWMGARTRTYVCPFSPPSDYSIWHHHKVSKSSFSLAHNNPERIRLLVLYWEDIFQVGFFSCITRNGLPHWCALTQSIKM